jgi:hypothetical protein
MAAQRPNASDPRFAIVDQDGNVLGTADNPLKFDQNATSVTFEAVQTALAAADGAVDLNDQSVTGVDDLAVGGDATITGALALLGAFKGTVADAGAAAASGTVNAHFGTFTVASGGSGYVLTNNKITASSLLFCMCISGAVARSVFSFIPTSNTGTLLLSGAAGADSKFAFLVVTPA